MSLDYSLPCLFAGWNEDEPDEFVIELADARDPNDWVMLIRLSPHEVQLLAQVIEEQQKFKLVHVRKPPPPGEK